MAKTITKTLDQMSVLRRLCCLVSLVNGLFTKEGAITKTVYVGLDVHADTIAVATADEGRDGEVRVASLTPINNLLLKR